MVTILNIIATVLMAITILGIAMNFIFNKYTKPEKFSFYDSLLDLFLGLSGFFYVIAFILEVFY